MATACLIVLLSGQLATAGSKLSGCISPPNRDCAIAIVSEYAETTPYAQDSAGLLAHVGAELAKAGRLTAADDAFSRAVEAAVTIESPTQSYSNLLAIARLQKLAGRNLAAQKTLSIAANVVLEEPHNVLGSLVTSQTMNLLGLAEEQRAVGDDTGAAETLAITAELAKTIDDARTRADQLALVAAQQTLIADQQEAADMNFAAARAAIAGIPELTLRAMHLASLARAQAEAGRTEVALANIEQAYAISEEIAEPLDRGRLQAQIALTLLTFMAE